MDAIISAEVTELVQRVIKASFEAALKQMLEKEEEERERQVLDAAVRKLAERPEANGKTITVGEEISVSERVDEDVGGEYALRITIKISERDTVYLRYISE